ncbi:MAG: aldo/keto reductase, partial [Verrucomicrobia bacterium]|nr:aldo/keto reductase [Verrucomicrobiota bacterium]
MTSQKISDSPIIFGCMMIGGSFDDSTLTAETIKRGRDAIDAALECGLYFFDHANIYCWGKSEEVFGRFL